MNLQKKLSSSHSMRNLNDNNNFNNNGVRNRIKKANIEYPERSSKNISIIDKKLPFINISLNKKNGQESDINYILYGKDQNNNQCKFKSCDLDYDYFTDRIKNKRIKSNKNKINYNNSVNYIFDSYRKAMK